MKTVLTITDVTRMGSPWVCVAGVTDNRQTIRPEFPSGRISEQWLYQDQQPIIRPFARVHLDLIENRPDPPHCEDWVIQPERRNFLGVLDENEKYSFLEKIVDPSVDRIFGAEIQRDIGFNIREHEGNRSLGTIRGRFITHITLWEKVDHRLDYRIEFVDQENSIYSLSVTDLSIRYFVDYERGNGADLRRIVANLENHLQRSEIFLRIGLARPTWSKYPHRCFLQVNGIYTFPDYLEGRCFADFQRIAAI